MLQFQAQSIYSQFIDPNFSLSVTLSHEIIVDLQQIFQELSEKQPNRSNSPAKGPLEAGFLRDKIGTDSIASPDVFFYIIFDRASEEIIDLMLKDSFARFKIRRLHNLTSENLYLFFVRMHIQFAYITTHKIQQTYFKEKRQV